MLEALLILGITLFCILIGVIHLSTEKSTLSVPHHMNYKHIYYIICLSVVSSIYGV